MSLNQINRKIKEFNDTKNSKLNSFGNFLEVLKNKTDLIKFENENRQNFHDEYEYVQLFKYLKSKNIVLKNIEGINLKTLDQIKQIYNK